ncbi:MAG: hypothetical protein ACK50G_01120 [bacterium]
MHEKRRIAMLSIAALPVALCLRPVQAAMAVIDYSNLMQNIQQVMQAVQQYQTQLQQYATMVQNLKQLDPSNIARTVAGGMDEGRDALRLLQQTQQLYGTTDDIRRRFTERSIQARMQGMTWDQFLADQAQRRRNGEMAAVRRVQEDSQAIERFERQARVVQEMSLRVTGTEGMQQSFAVLNAQMNTLLQQNSAVLRMMVEDRIEQRGVQEGARIAAADELARRQQETQQFERNRYDDDMRAIDAMRQLKDRARQRP